MNNKIKELAEKAGYKDSWDSIFDDDYENFDIEKFSKLLIIEASNLIDGRINSCVANDDFGSGYVCGMDGAISILSKHFGIE